MGGRVGNTYNKTGGGGEVGSPYRAKGGEEGAHATVDTRYLDYVESTMGVQGDILYICFQK